MMGLWPEFSVPGVRIGGVVGGHGEVFLRDVPREHRVTGLQRLHGTVQHNGTHGALAVVVGEISAEILATNGVGTEKPLMRSVCRGTVRPSLQNASATDYPVRFWDVIFTHTTSHASTAPLQERRSSGVRALSTVKKNKTFGCTHAKELLPCNSSCLSLTPDKQQQQISNFRCAPNTPKLNHHKIKHSTSARVIVGTNRGRSPVE